MNYDRNQPKFVRRKDFRIDRKQYFAKDQQKLSYTFAQLIGTVKKVVLSAKMTDTKFENKSVTGSKVLERIINEAGFSKGETIQSMFSKYFMSYDCRKSDFKKMSQMFRIFLPKMTQVIMGEIYDFAMKYQRWNCDYKKSIERSHRQPNYHEQNVYYDDKGCMNDERLKPLNAIGYKYFAQKLFYKRYPELWYAVKPDVPLIGQVSMSVGGKSTYGDLVSFCVEGTKISFDMYSIIKYLTGLMNGTESEFIKLKYKKLIEIAENSNKQCNHVEVLEEL